MKPEDITVERDADDPDILRITFPDPRPTAHDLAVIRATVQAVIAGMPRLPDETAADHRERVRAACIALCVTDSGI